MPASGWTNQEPTERHSTVWTSSNGGTWRDGKTGWPNWSRGQAKALGGGYVIHMLVVLARRPNWVAQLNRDPRQYTGRGGCGSHPDSWLKGELIRGLSSGTGCRYLAGSIRSQCRGTVWCGYQARLTPGKWQDGSGDNANVLGGEDVVDVLVMLAQDREGGQGMHAQAERQQLHVGL